MFKIMTQSIMPCYWKKCIKYRFILKSAIKRQVIFDKLGLNNNT